MLKIPVKGGLITLKSSRLVPLKCAMVSGPVRQKKRGQAADRNLAIQKEVMKLVEAGIMKEVHYHDWAKGVSRQSRSCPQSFIPEMFKRRAEVKWKTHKPKQVLIQISREIIAILQNFEKCIKKSDFHWTIEAEEAFKQMKKLIAELLMLAAPIEKEELIVYLATAKETLLSRPKVAGRIQKWSIKLGEYAIHYRTRVSVKGQILADFIVERPEEDSKDTLMEEVKELPEPWILFTDGSSCTDGSGAVVEEEGDNWMTPIFKYLAEDTLPTDVKEARAVRQDLVYRNNDANQVEDTGKLSPKWEGPYELTEALGKGTYKLRGLDGKQLSRTWNVRNLKKCYIHKISVPTAEVAELPMLKSLHCYTAGNEKLILQVVVDIQEFGDSYEAPPEESGIGSASKSSAKKKGRTVAITTEDMQKRKNDVKARTTLLLALPDEHQLRFSKRFRDTGANLQQTAGHCKHLEFMDVEIKRDDLNQKFLTSLAPEWLMYTIVWRNRNDLDTLSLDDVYNHLKVYEPEIKYKDINQIDEDDIKEMDIKWNMALLRHPGAKIGVEEKTTNKSYISNEEENHALVADDEAPTEFALMAKSSSSSKNKEVRDLIRTRRVLDTVMFPLPTQVYSLPKKDMSWTGLPEFANDTITDYSRPSHSIESNTSNLQNSNSSISEHEESSSSILSKPMIKFVKAVRTQFQVPKVPTVTKKFPTVDSKVSNAKSTFSAGLGNKGKAVKASACWIWRPKQNTTDKGPNSNSVSGNSQNNVDDKEYWDSGCSLHMTGNISYLSDYEPYDGGYVSFGQGGGKITGKDIIKTGKLEFENVYFVKDLKYNLFSVSQIRDNKNSVLFTNSECIVLGKDFKLKDNTNVLLGTPRQHNMYSIDLNNIVPHKDLTCLVAKASADESLPSKCYENDHTCVACPKGKQHKVSCKTKLVNSVSKPLHTLHMDLFGPTSVSSLNHKWNFIIEIENLKDLKLKIIKCDNGGEFRNTEMNEFCSRKGIKREFSNARTPQQNGVAERRNKTLIEAVRIMLPDAKLPVTFWAEAFKIAWFLRPFGWHVMILNSLDHLGKFDAKGDEGTKDVASQDVKKDVSSLRYIAFLNWLHEAYLEDTCNAAALESSGNSNPTATLKNPSANQMETLTVESAIPTVSSPVPTTFLDDSLETSSDTRIISKRVTSQDKTPSLNNILTLSHMFEDILGDTINSVDTNGVEADLSNMETSITASPTPTFRIHKDHPKSQIIGPMDTLVQTKHKSKEMEEHRVRPIGTKWVLKNRKDERGIVIRNKARLVVQGYTQEKGINYEEVFAPVARIEAIRLFLAYALFMGFIVYEMDVKSAFLYGTIDEEVYVMQPPGFQDPEFLDRVYKVKKAMYELHQAPRAWYGTLEFEALMHDKFQMSAMDVRSANTPMDKENPWGKDRPGKNVELHLYRSMIRSLMYLTASRPDIMFAVCACARYQVTHKKCHLHAVNRIFRYLKGHPKLGLWYPKESPFDLVAYSDSDYGGATQDRKSTTGGCQFLGRRLISWQCKKQTIVTL
nr:hypothetical protein [Tanacetum cinerariifolium]